MKYQLYYAERSASMGVRVLLEEIGANYELISIDISREIEREPEFLALNPNGWVPVLIWQDKSMYECGAITTFLCDRYPEAGLAPAPNDVNRGHFLQWIFFFSSSIQNAYQMTYYPDRFCDSVDDQASVIRRSRNRLNELWSVVDEAIGENDWLLGDQFSAADIYLFMLTTWLSTTPPHNHFPVTTWPNVNRIAQKVMQRPSVAVVYKTYVTASG